jgi:hypothetical protein
MSLEVAGHGHGELEELAWDAPLALVRRETGPHELWVLEQRGRPVAAVRRTWSGWSAQTAGHRCSAAIRRRRRRLGWHIAVTLAGRRAPALDYRPHTVRTGGTLELADGGRYKLRCLARLGYDWSLATADGDRLARISRRIDTPSGSAVARDRSGLTPAAAHEADLGLLIVGACVAIVIHHQQPTGAG